MKQFITTSRDWKDSVTSKKEARDLISDAILLYLTFSGKK